MFDWRDYLALANDLGAGARGTTVSVNRSEAADRCAVSRAYYRAFCHARNYARQRLGFVPTNRGDDHWLLRRHLARHGRNIVAQRLGQLHTWRKLCDYDDAVANLPVVVRSALREAAAVIQAL